MKRILDILFSAAAIVLLSPLFLLIAFFIKLDSEGPVFFRQERAGRHGKNFRIWKFRTMVENAQAMGPAITAKKDNRVTQMGQVLRRLKLDELPQLLNVLTGEMSFVGPRPEVPSMVARYSEEDRRVLDVKPGLLGAAQLVHRNEEALLPENGDVEAFYVERILPGKLKIDLAYAKSRDPFKDLKILSAAVPLLFFGSVKWSYVFESRRRFSFMIFDMVVSALCYAGAFMLRFDNNIPAHEAAFLKSMLPFVVILRAPCFVYFGLYQTLWQYLGLEELVAIIKAVVVGSLLIPVVGFAFQLDFPPRSTLIIDCFLLIMALGFSRMIFKVTADRLRKTRIGGNRKNVVIVGAGDTGEMLIREFIKRPELGYRPVAFLDDDPLKAGLRIHGVKVFGGLAHLAHVTKIKKAEALVLALPEASAEVIQMMIRDARRLGLSCRIVPRMANILSPQIVPLQLREIDVADLLGRSLVRGDVQGLQNFIAGKRILITGAGGSIGSELARMVYQHHPRELILVDCAESNLYEIETQLRDPSSQVKVLAYLRDVKDEPRMRKIFETHRPEVVYHASAYKHVPLVEDHYAEGITNNVLGTKTAADLAAEFGSERFVLISTDKAIRPKSVMGATKRIGELYIQSLKGKKTKFMAVRFGNVFNSRGSVVPLFKRQIEQGGPVTVTDPEVKRYFMDVSEAVFLILEASMIGEDSQIFVLDMGQPVKIVDLAQNLIQLMGFSLEQVPIRFTGLRPGEKMEEDIEMKNEILQPTAHEKIRIWKSAGLADSKIEEKVLKLLELAKSGGSRDAVTATIREIVPEYEPWRF